MHANQREERDGVGAGQIVAIQGMKNTTTGDTLCDPDKPVLLESMNFPAPVIHVAIEPKTKADQQKLGEAIQRLAEEDPTFQVRTDEETGQTIIAGMGELHLDVLVDRMRREFKVEANVGKPQVAYRETIRRKVEKVDYTHKKQTGGSGQFAKVQIDLEPSGGDGGGYEFVNAVTGGRIPREYIPSVDAGCQEAMEFGVLAGYPLVDVKVTLQDGQSHDVDSSELAFKIAGSMAFKEAARRADPAILEPMMAVEVTTPDDYLGDVIGDLNSRRGQIQSMEERSGARLVTGPRPVVGDVRLRGGPPLQDLGAGELQHAVRFLRRGPAVAGDRRSSRRHGESEHANGPLAERHHCKGPRRVVRHGWRRRRTRPRRTPITTTSYGARNEHHRS